jgi:dipeptidase D
LIDLTELGNPKDFWEYFYQITKIPRCSKKEEKIRNFILAEALKFGFQTRVDGANNVVVRIQNGTGSAVKTIVLQSHLDMVCEKNEGISHDFSREPLKLQVIERQGKKWLTAIGTTLGADNGVGIAYQLMIMKRISERNLTFENSDIDLLFTVDEESGLTGASNIGDDMIKGKYLLNLDSEEDDRFTIGCAGGLTLDININIAFDQEKDEKRFIPLKLKVRGLQGGHSGTDINKGRANAIKILTETLWTLKNAYEFHLQSIQGGNLHNAIPREAWAVFFCKESDREAILKEIIEIALNAKALYEGIELDMDIEAHQVEDVDKCDLMSRTFQEKLLEFLFLVPNGLLSVHPRIKELVHTSSNLASIKMKGSLIEIQISQRSLSEHEKGIILEKIKTLLQLTGLSHDIQVTSEYPSWPPNFDSDLVKMAKETYHKLFNDEVIIQAIHAGLECAILRYKYPDMEMISLGPTVQGAHSPNESLDIYSVEKMWIFIKAFLKILDRKS